MSKSFTDNDRRQLVARWRDSGESARTFSARHDVAQSTFYEWARRFPEPEPPAFSEVTVVDAPPPRRATSASIELEIDGVLVRVGADADADALRRVLEVLRAC